MSNKYDSYKDSGIDWIGDVPSHWESWKISHAFNRIGSGTTPESGNPIYHENGTINWLNTGDLNDGVLDSCSKKITTKALEDYSSLKLFPTGSLVMAMYGATIGKTAILNFETTTNQACCVFCDSSIIDLKFLQYWFIGNKEQIINLAIGGGQPNISQNILKDIRVWCPDYSEQVSLTQFLDHKTTQIDHLIAKKEQFIQLLEEERVAVINQAVTKGLDPSVPMKDSGIEWLGEIPVHWEVILFKRVISKIKDGTHGTFQRLSEGHPFLSAKNVYDDGLKISETESLISENDYLEITKNGFPKRNDLLITCVGTIGRTFVYDLDEPFAFQRSVTFIRFNENINPDYYKFYVQSSIYQNLLISLAKTSAQSGIYMNDLMNTYALKTPSNEQNKIVEFLKIKTHEIDKIVLKAQQEIVLLKEYKTALISEVVTGKVDVSTSSTQVLETKN